MRALTFAALALSLVGCVGDDSTTPPDGGSDVTTDSPAVDSPSDAKEAGPTCTGTQTACGSACVDLQTDDANCGACGHACETGTTCTSGVCPPVTVCNAGGANPNDTDSLVLFKGAAYFQGLKSVLACNLTQTNATASTFFSTSLNGFSMTGLTGDSNFFYFVNHNITSNSNALTRCDGNQTDTTFVMTYPSSWVSSYVRTDDDPSTGKLFASLTTEADMVTVDPGDAGATTFTCVSNISTLSSAAAGSGKYVFADSFTKKVEAATITGTTCSAPATIAGGLTAPAAVAIQGSTVAFADGSGNVYACDASIGCTPQVPPTPLVTGQGSGVVAIAIDSSTPPNLYWVGSAGLVRCSSAAGTCNGKPLVLAPNATPTAGIALDATNVYYLQAGVLFRVAK